MGSWPCPTRGCGQSAGAVLLLLWQLLVAASHPRAVPHAQPNAVLPSLPHQALAKNGYLYDSTIIERWCAASGTLHVMLGWLLFDVPHQTER